MIILWCITQCCVKAHLKEALAVTSCMPKRSSVNIALVWNGAENRHYCPIDPKTSPPSFHRCHGHATCPGRPSPFVPVGCDCLYLHPGCTNRRARCGHCHHCADCCDRHSTNFPCNSLSLGSSNHPSRPSSCRT